MSKSHYLAFFAFLISLCTPVGIAHSYPVEISQVSNTEDTRSAAEESFSKGWSLYKEGSAESLRQAIIEWKKTLKLWQQVEDDSEQALTLIWLGNVYSDLGEKQQALEYYGQALPLYRAVEDQKWQATTLNNIGLVYSELGEKAEALNYYNQALSLYRAVNDDDGEAITLNNIGLIYSSLGEKAEALNYYNQALSLYRAVNDDDGEAVTLNNIGLVYSELGNKEEALNYYNQALPLLRAIGNSRVEATTINNLALVYDELGRKEKALNHYQQALLIRRTIGDRNGEAVTLNNIGIVYSSLGKKEEALKHYHQALPLLHALGNKEVEATTLNNIGIEYSSLGKKEEALNHYHQALSLYRAITDRDGEAVTLNNIGIEYSGLGEKEEALNHYNQALTLYRAVGYQGGQVNTLWNIAQLQYEQSNLIAASATMEQAIEKIEFLRNQIFTTQLQESFYLTVEKYYDFQIRLLMELQQQNPSPQYHAQALHYSERVRARQLLTELQEANVDIHQGVDPQLLAKEKQLNQQLTTALSEKAILLRGTSSNREKEDFNKQINSLIAELDKVEAAIRLQSPAYAAINQPTKFTLKTREIQQQLLDNDTLLLEYYLSEEGSYLWVVSKNKVSSYKLPPKAEIEQLAQQFRNDIASETINNPEIGQKLSQIILVPAAQELGNKRLLIVGDGTLQSIPFAALPSPNLPTSQPLIANHEIITLPSASSLAALQQQVKGRPLAPKKLAVLADPVYEQEGSEEGQPNLSELSGVRAAQNACVSLQDLPYTRTEAENILNLVSQEEGFKALGHEASLRTATNPQLSQYQILHFATHGCINQDVPQFSGLALSVYNSQGETQDPLLRLDTIYNLVLPAELVVLSACETGLGSELAGEGLISLTRGFMYAGAKRVVVSFWSVNDSSTAELMSKFYEKMYQEKLKPAAALRAAQLEMWQGEENSDWQDPYHWAAFTVQGEW